MRTVFFFLTLSWLGVANASPVSRLPRMATSRTTTHGVMVRTERWGEPDETRFAVEHGELVHYHHGARSNGAQMWVGPVTGFATRDGEGFRIYLPTFHLTFQPSRGWHLIHVAQKTFRHRPLLSYVRRFGGDAFLESSPLLTRDQAGVARELLASQRREFWGERGTFMISFADANRRVVETTVNDGYRERSLRVEQWILPGEGVSLWPRTVEWTGTRLEISGD